jgi:hypothetical protein
MTRCMVAHPGPDVLIWVLTCRYAAPYRARPGWQMASACPVGAGRERSVATICAQYVPKFSAIVTVAGEEARSYGAQLAQAATTFCRCQSKYLPAG